MQAQGWVPRRRVRLRVEYAEISLCGARESNQDRVGSVVMPDAVMLAVLDGMGGHLQGELAASTGCVALLERFRSSLTPLPDAAAFLGESLQLAHAQVVALGQHMPLERRPRATCAVCLVQDNVAWYAHLGDSRVYLLRQGTVHERTRDHSHVEQLVQHGIITEEQVNTHPLRNYVEACIGGDPLPPVPALSAGRAVLPGDILLVCTDGFWSGLTEREIATTLYSGYPVKACLEALAELSVRRCGAGSDNTTAAVLRLKE